MTRIVCHRRGLAALLTVVALDFGAAAPATAAPSAPAALVSTPDSFYVPPSPLPEGAPGDTIKAEPTQVYLDPVKLGANSSGLDVPTLLPIPPGQISAYRFMYLSRTATGQPQALTGTLMLPNIPWIWTGPRPLVGYSVGGHGMGPQCAPSWQLMEGIQPELAVIAAYLNSGFAVVATDYQRAPTHTFAEPASAGQAVLDSIRGATRLQAQQGVPTGLDATNPVVISGYSEGGNASSAAAEQQPSYAPEINLKAVATGGVPADLQAVARAVDGELLFGTVFMAIHALAASYPDLDVDDLPLNAAGWAALADVEDECISGIVSKYAYRHAGEFIDDGGSFDDALDQAPAWKAALAALRIGQRKPSVPVLLYHGAMDPWVPYNVGVKLGKDWCAQGASIAFHTYPVAEHFGGLVEAVPAVITWLTAQAVGLPAVSTCSLPPLAGLPISIPPFFL
jgi:acetyl esterase/lipase